MAADLTTVPWSRLSKLAPPGATTVELQEAADRWEFNADLYSAAADLWDDKALQLKAELTLRSTNEQDQVVTKVSQDGITVEYKDSTNAVLSRYNACKEQARQLRARSKPTSPLQHNARYDSWTGRQHYIDEDVIIPVIE
jgi:hypothetical protein